eukprot:5745682-Pyramimonas_sp.AAC.4
MLEDLRLAKDQVVLAIGEDAANLLEKKNHPEASPVVVVIESHGFDVSVSPVAVDTPTTVIWIGFFSEERADTISRWVQLYIRLEVHVRLVSGSSDDKDVDISDTLAMEVLHCFQAGGAVGILRKARLRTWRRSQQTQLTVGE